jgi:phospholipase/carboxylesterase
LYIAKIGYQMNLLTNSISALIISMFSIINVKAQIDVTVEKKQALMKDIYFQSTSLYKCKIKKPKNYNPEKKYQLVIGLHGGGSSLDSFINVWDDIDNVNFIYAVPQGPYAWPTENEISYDWSMWPSKDEKGIQKATELVPNYIADLVKELESQFRTDGIYLMGFSQGAIFTYITGIQNYHLFMGIICLSGPGIFEHLMNPFTGATDSTWIEKKYLGPAKSLKVFIAHGVNDKMVEYNSSLKSRDVLRQHGYDVEHYDFKGGHSIDKNILKHAIEWLNKHN